MSDREFVLAPTVVTVDFQVHQYFALMNSLTMLNEVDEYPGVDTWLIQTAKNLPADTRYDNELLMMVCYSALLGLDESVTGFEAWVNALAGIDPLKIQETVAKAFTSDEIRHKHPEVTIPDLNMFIQDETTALNYLEELYRSKEKTPDLDKFRAAHRMIQDPVQMRTFMVNHLRYMWNNFLQEEWKRVEPILSETVRAFQKLDYKGMSGIEVGRVVTGRDMTGTWIGDEMEKAQRMVFVPAPHVGPYVGAFDHDNGTLYIYFRPHLPEGTTQVPSAALNRSELLVRLSALADDSRLRILELFKDQDELCAQDIIQLLDLSQSAASRHLRQLTATGYLIERRKEGAKCYRMNTERARNTLQALQSFLSIH